MFTYTKLLNMERLNVSIIEFANLITKLRLPIMMNAIGVSKILWFNVTATSFTTYKRDENGEPVYTADTDLNERYRLDISVGDKAIFINQFINITDAIPVSNSNT